MACRMDLTTPSAPPYSAFTLATCAPVTRRQVCVQRRPLANGTDVRRRHVWRHVASVKALLVFLSFFCLFIVIFHKKVRHPSVTTSGFERNRDTILVI